MAVRKSGKQQIQQASISRIGQRRQVVIPKHFFEAMRLQEGDFLEVTAGPDGLQMRPKRLVDLDDTLAAKEAVQVRRGEADIAAGRSKPRRAVKRGLGR